MRGNHFLVHTHKKDLPQSTCIFHLLKYVVNKSFSVSHFTSLFFAETETIFCALAPLITHQKLSLFIHQKLFWDIECVY